MRHPRTMLWALVAAAAAFSPAASVAASLPGVLTGTSSRSPFSVRPAEIYYTGDSTGVLGGFNGTGRYPNYGHVKWGAWTQSEAQGSGAVWLNDCKPDCATGHFSPFAVTVRAFAPESGHFTRLTLRYVYRGKEVTDTRGVVKSGAFYQYGVVGFTERPAPGQGNPPPPTGSCQSSVPVFAHVVAVGSCLQSAGKDLYRSVGRLRVNGLDFVAADNGTITLHVGGRRVTATGSGVIEIGSVPVSAWSSALDFDLAAPLRFALLGGRRAPQLLGFPLQNVLAGHWDPNKSAVDLKGSVGLEVLGDKVTGTVVLSSDNEHGLSLDSVEIKLAKVTASPDPNHHAGESCNPDDPPPAGFDCVGTATSNASVPISWALQPLDTSLLKLGGWLPIDNLDLRWDRAKGIWSGRAALSLSGLFGGGGARVLPSLQVEVGISVFPFVFDYGLAQLDHLNVPLPGGEVFLQTVGLELHLHPSLEVGGKLAISAGPAILGHPGLSIDAGFDYKRGATQGYKVTLNGDAQVGGQVTLGSASVTYDSSDGGTRVSFGGQIGGSWGPVQAQLNVSGDINAQHVEAIGDAQLSAYGAGVSGRGVISDAGFGACGTLNVLLYHGDIGFKHQFSTGETDFDGCDFSGLYTISGSGAHASVAGPSSTVTLPGGRSQVEFAAAGTTGPPSVVLTGPGGVRLSTPTTSDRVEVSQQNLTIADTGSRSVYFIIQHPAAGAWTMAPGSSGPPPVRFERADPWLNPDIRARVRSRGAQQTLGWRLRFQPGQTVSFLEQGPAVDHTLTGAVAPRGRVTFRPAAGPGGIRRIVALVEKDGFLRERLTVATFRARSPRRPRPSAASYRIHRGQLLLRWRPTDGAGAYEADVTLARASMLRVAAAAGQQQVRVTLPAGARVRRVTVAAVYAGRNGPSVIARRRR